MHILGCLDVPTAGHVPPGRRRRRRRSTRASSPRCATGASASCSSSSTCSPTCRRGATSSCRSCTPACRAAERRERALAALDAGRPGRPGRPPARRAVRRPAAARRGRPGPGHRAGADPRRRADRQPRLDVDRRRARPCSTSCTTPGRTIVLITHEHDVAARAERTVQVRDGDVVEPSARCRRPVKARHDLARRPSAPADRGGPQPPAALGADHARHPHRHHRGDPHRRPRPRRPGRRCSDQINALGTNLLVVSPGSSTDARGVRGGFGIGVDPHRWPTPRRSPTPRCAPDVAAVAPTSTVLGCARPPATPTGRPRSPARHRRGSEVRSREVDDRAVLHRRRRGGRRRGGRARPRHRRRAVRSTATPSARRSRSTASPLEVIGVLAVGRLVGRPPATTTWRSSRLDLPPARSSAARTATSVSIDLRARPTSDRTRSRPPTRRPTQPAAQPARDHRQPTTPTSPSPPRSRSSRPPPRSTRR